MTKESGAQSQSVKVSVSYLGFIRDMTGSKEDHFELPKPVHIDDVLSKAMEVHPRVAKVRSMVRVAVNGAITRENLELQDADTVSLMAPVVGG